MRECSQNPTAARTNICLSDLESGLTRLKGVACDWIVHPPFPPRRWIRYCWHFDGNGKQSWNNDDNKYEEHNNNSNKEYHPLLLYTIIMNNNTNTITTPRGCNGKGGESACVVVRVCCCVPPHTPTTLGYTVFDRHHWVVLKHHYNWDRLMDYPLWIILHTLHGLFMNQLP